jgi:hypothetical protein
MKQSFREIDDFFMRQQPSKDIVETLQTDFKEAFSCM